MKNLELLELAHKSTPGTFSRVKNLCQFNDSIYYIDGATSALFKYDLISNTALELCPKSFNDVLAVKVLQFDCKICVVSKSCLELYDFEGVEVARVEFAKEIDAVAWNSSEGIMATASRNGDVQTFVIDYSFGEIFSEECSSVNANIPDTVYVGWGSKDTQFRGSEGKLKKDQAPVETKPVLDEVPVISWRGNDEMFVVNYWKDGVRKFVVFDSTCKALYRSEECLGLQPCIAWRPTGNMIAAITEINDTQSVVIFEKNGQKRFTFNINFDKVIIKNLKWSPCAQILLIHAVNLATDEQSLHLLTSSNYRWYEKQTLRFTSYNHLIDFDWLDSTQSTYCLHIVTTNDVIKYTFKATVNNIEAICGVTNGRCLQLTNFSDAIIPPILFSRKVLNDNSINFVTFLRSNRVVIIDSRNFLKVIDVESDQVVASVDLNNKFDDMARIPLVWHHLVCSKNLIYLIAEKRIYCVNIDSGNVDLIQEGIAHEIRFMHIISDKISSSGLKHIKGELYINCDDNNKNLQNCIKESVKIINGKTFICRLTSNCHFYINDNKVSDTVNSFMIFNDYLLLTTKLNELYCTRLIDDIDLKQSYRRSVEQGSMIVAAIPNSSQIVLQLPRGNLETISCRLISIDILDRLLSDSKWDEAVRFIRLEKLNANLLFDLNAQRFLDQIDQFIDGVQTINELNAICLEFEDNNVLNTIYKNWGKVEEFPGKIKTIFKAILNRFDEIDYVPFISTIMIINLNFFSVREALIYIQDLLRRSYDNPDLKKIVIGAINTLKTYGSDQEKLYSEALLLYDIDLAHFVASNCQMDPRIYEPHLNNLKNLSEIEMRYEINSYAKRSKVAIAYLLRCPETNSEDVLKFIKSHSVSREGYESCNTNSKHFKAVSLAFADDLSKKGCHREAAVVLKRAGLIKEALNEFKVALCWRDVLNLMQELVFGDVEKITIINEMANDMVQKRLMIKEAAFLYEHHANNYEMAVKILIDNTYFDEAIYLARKYERRDIIIADVLPAIRLHYVYLKSKVGEMTTLFGKYRSRLEEVRRKKWAQLSCDGDERDVGSDLFSDAGSVISRSSRSSRSRTSTASSRNRRKEERKKQDLREGGIYEDIALIRALHLLVKEIYARAEDVRDCCLLLLQENVVPYVEAKELYDMYIKLDVDVENGIPVIWPRHFYLPLNTQNEHDLVDLENFEHLDLEFRTPPDRSTTWKLNIFH